MPPAAITNLTERRVPQFVAIYLGAAWGLVQFVDFIGTRYGLSPRWTDLTLLAFALLLPSVLLYTYHHGRPGRDEWQRSEKLFIPINLLLLVGVLLVAGAGTNLSALTTHVTVTDEKGNTIDALVPSKAYRKRVAMFNFDAAGAASQVWARVGLPWLVIQDLQQQQFLETVPHRLMRERLQQAGFEGGADVPLALKRNVANEMHIPYFVTGTVQSAGSEVAANVQVYETSSLKLLKEQSFRAPNVAAVADLISAHLLKTLDIPVLADARPNLAVSELTSANPQALQSYLEGLVAIHEHDDWAEGRRLLERATTLDKTFAAAQLALAEVSVYTGRPDAALAAAQAALDHSYRLPERTQQYAKAMYYSVKPDYARAFAVLDMLSKLYPDDLEVLQQLLAVNQVRDNKPAMIEAIEKMLELDPTRGEMLLMLGNIYEQQGEAPKALKQYETYAARYPNEAKSYRTIGTLHRRTGNHASARQAYERALLARPEDVSTLVEFATLERNIGDFAAADDKLAQATAAARTPQESALVLEATAALQDSRGRITASIATMSALLVEMAKFSPPAYVFFYQLRLPGRYGEIDPARARSELARVSEQITKPFDVYLPLAQIDVYDRIEDVDGEEQAVAALDAVISKNAFNVMKPAALHAHGRVLEMRGNCEQAVQWYAREIRLDPLDVKPQLDLGRCYRKLGRQAEAEKALNEVLRIIPSNGKAHLELALLYKASGDQARSTQHAQRAGELWKHADPSYKPLKTLKSM